MTVRLGEPLLRRQRVASTMDVVASLGRAGAPEGLVVVAEEQTSGRGRAGRAWVAPAGTGLLCSILLRPPVRPADLSALPLLIGVAVSRAIEAVAPVCPSVKWPNDVLIDGRKVAGILLNARATAEHVDFVVAGIGVNVSATTAGNDGAITIEEASRSSIDQRRLLDGLLEELSSIYNGFLGAPATPDLEPWRARAHLRSEQVTIRDGNRELVGRFHDVDSTGALLLEDPDGSLRRIISGDLIRGPRSVHSARAT